MARSPWRGAILAGILSAAPIVPTHAVGNSCAHKIIGKIVSPDGLSQAFVDESMCAAALDIIDVTDLVRVSRVGAVLRATPVLGIDIGGHPEDRPRLSWSGANVLDVTVPNLSYLKILSLHPADIQIRLHVDPDDPAARAAWLRQQHLDPDPPH